ncbi:hypothetical protein V8G54_015019 [Vigna mungo]|uniref:SWIM-type domain-containing protein n=1 Tax=Vigna mungo TaxID=3915 RepID=A0AAQ3S009_VIGMU
MMRVDPIQKGSETERMVLPKLFTVFVEESISGCFHRKGQTGFSRVNRKHAKSKVRREIRAFELRHWIKGCFLEVGGESLRPKMCIASGGGVDFRSKGCDSPWGKLVNEGCLKYVGESDTMFFYPDKWSYFVVLSVVKALGYNGFKDLWYFVGCGPVLDNKLEPLSDDVRAMHMVNLAKLNGQIHLYVVHLVSEVDVIHMIEYNGDEGGEDVEPEMHEGDEGGEDVEPEMHNVDEGGEDVEPEMHEGDEGGQDVEPEMHNVDEGGEDVEPEMHEGDEGGQDVEPEMHNVDGGVTEQMDEGVGEGDERIEHDEGDDDRTRAINVEETIVVESERIQPDEGDDERTNPIDVEDTTVVDVAHDERTKANDVVEGNIEVEVREWCSSDDDTGEVSGMNGLVDINIECEYRDNDTCGNMEVDCSALSDPELEDDDISDTSLFNYEWESEDLSSPEISDEESDDEEKKDIMDAIKTYALENGRNLKFMKNDKKRIRLKCVRAKEACPWMAYFAYMEAVDTWQLRTVVDKHTCSREHKLGVFNAKWLTYASDEVEGSFTMQYLRIYDYAHELLARNPGSTIKVAVQENDGKRIFFRYRGELLTVVARDANDQMMSLAYAIVEVENKDTWSWFMELLIEDLGILYANFRRKFLGKNLKKLMWRAPTTTHPQKWENEMRNIRSQTCVPKWKKFVVNIEEYSCSCRKWSISGIPCAHALVAMRFLNLDAEEYILVCFLTSTYEEMYTSIIYLINGNNMWEVTQYPDIMPPSRRKLPDRPKKKRRLEQWELKKDSTRMTKGGLVNRCSKCREMGHNKNRCPNSNEQPVVQAEGEEPTALGQGAAQAEEPHH